MVTTMKTVLDTVKISLGFSQAEADHYLTIHEEAGFVVVKLRAKSYMEPTTWNAFIALMKQLGAVHEKENSPTFEIPIQTSGPTQTVTPKQEEEATTAYSLASSKEGLGELVPVLVDKFHNIIDGFHRKGENANWREEVLDWIDTPEKLEAARLAVNFARRQMAPEEIRERITFLISKGMKPLQIAKLTGIKERTVYKYMPQDAKDPLKVEAGRKAHGETREDTSSLAERVQLDKRKGLGEQPTNSYLDRFAECSGCNLMLYTASLVDGKCPTCRERETRQQKAPQKAAIDAEPPVDVETEIRAAPRPAHYPELEVPCGTCANNATCDRQYFCVNKEGTAYVCERKKPVPQLPNEEIIFLINLPSTISLSKEKLEEFFTSRDYDETGLTKRQVAQTPAGLTVTFDLQQWNNSNIEDGAPLGVKHSSIFRDELISILEGEPTCNIDELEKITIQQLHPTDPEPEPEPEQKKPKAVKEIDWNAQGVSCPCCGCTISQEKYQRLKEKFSKFPGLFAE